MGNALFRKSPRKIYESSSGNTSRFEFAANQITGWRNSQEDRFVTLPNFYEDFSLFAVYDGHGGEDVAQYLQRSLHQFILRELELTRDIELALYLSFLNCDNSLRSINEDEKELIENDLVQEINLNVPDQAERQRAVLGSVDDAGTSGENQERDELRAMIASACVKEIPSIAYMAQTPMEESEDESDEDYTPGDKDINFLKDGKDSDEKDSSDEFSDSHESIEDDCMEKLDGAEIAENTGKTNKEILEERLKEALNEDKDSKKIGSNSGSTATVLLINANHIYIAHVGDSRCVACIKGNAVELSSDHRPTNNDEMQRILSAGGRVTRDGRIFGDIDMSRAFGDFRYKSKEVFSIISAEPSISSLEITPDVEFVIVASDGIWNTMDSADVVDYIRRRISDPSLELKDLCGELFEEMVPEKITSDGSGCDNMTAIIIKFNCSLGLGLNSNFCHQEIYQYIYPSVNTKSNKTLEENLVRKEIPQIKDCEGSSQLQFDDETMISESSENNEYDVSECRDNGAKSESHGKMDSEDNEYSASGSSDKEVKSKFDGKIDSEDKSNSVEFLKFVEGIPTNQQQQMNASKQDFSDLATILAARPDQQIMSGSDGSRENVAFHNVENSPQPKETVGNSTQLQALENSNLLQNNQNSSVGTQTSPTPEQHSRSMCRVLNSLNYTEQSLQELHSKLSCVEQAVKREVARFNKKHLASFPYAEDLNTHKSPTSVNLIDHSSNNAERIEQNDVSQINRADMQSSMHIERGIMNADNLHTEEKNIPEKADFQSNWVITESPASPTNEEMTEIPELPYPTDIQSKELSVRNEEVVKSAIIEPPSVQNVTEMDKDIQHQGHSVETSEVVESATIESSSVENIVDITRETAELVKTNESSKSDEEIIIRDLCDKNKPVKKCDDFDR